MPLSVRTQLVAFRGYAADHAVLFLPKERVDVLMPGGGRTGIPPFPSVAVLNGAEEAMIGHVMDQFAYVCLPKRR